MGVGGVGSLFGVCRGVKVYWGAGRDSRYSGTRRV